MLCAYDTCAYEIFVATNTDNFVCTKRQHTSFFATKLCLLRQNFCCDKSFAAGNNWTRVCRDKKYFVVTIIILSRHKFCRNTHTFVATTKDVFCRDKYVFVATELLSRQKWYLWQLPPMVFPTGFTTTAVSVFNQCRYSHEVFWPMCVFVLISGPVHAMTDNSEIVLIKRWKYDIEKCCYNLSSNNNHNSNHNNNNNNNNNDVDDNN